MKNLKILIVEDSPITAMEIQEQLLELGYTNTFIAGDSDRAIRLFTSESIDFILMDIQLDGSTIDGITIAEIFNNIRKVPIIYLTSYDNEVILQRAGKTKPVNYLLKDTTSKEQLKIAINLAKDTFLPKNISFIRPNGTLEIVAIEDIVYCKADGTVTKVFLKDYKQDDENKDIPNFKAMNHLGFYAPRLENDGDFFRISSSILVNLAYLKEYTHSKRTLLLKNGKCIMAGREGGKRLNNYLKR